MTPNPSGIEPTVSRALRENLDRLQRLSDELHQAIGDLVAACASNRPANALPPMLRAQTAAAALAAALDVLARFVTAALQPAGRTPAEKEALRLVAIPHPEPAAPPVPPPPSIPVPMGEAAPAMEVEPAEESQLDAAVRLASETLVEAESTTEAAAAFDVNRLSREAQEMHRRANRVAKVSMQDIQMLRPEQIRLGREHRDICVRLRDDIDKAHKEYSRRFRPILDHPVDYFYHWMVQILGEGDPEKLGEYPYSSPVFRR